MLRERLNELKDRRFFPDRMKCHVMNTNYLAPKSAQFVESMAAIEKFKLSCP